ncbi:MAG: DUF3501 family protein [Gammaproteobacteria bacterium]
MQHLTREDLMSLETYAAERKSFRAQVMAHKQNRRVELGPHANLYFEDKLTMQYQIQEMLRVERIFEAEGIQEELDAYNPLIPDGCNWKATFMVEYSDVEQRKVELSKLIGIEDKIWVRVDGFDKVYAIADEDLEREDDTKTSSVHFMRFELSEEMASAVKAGAAIGMGSDHDYMTLAVDAVPQGVRDSLANDLA